MLLRVQWTEISVLLWLQLLTIRGGLWGASLRLFPLW
jgi:hypothetical protein